MNSTVPVGLVAAPVIDDRPTLDLARPGDRYERHPGDVLRLVLWAAITVLLVAVLETATRTATAIDADVNGWVEAIPELARELGRTVLGFMAFGAPILVAATLILRRRWRRLVTLGATALLAAAALAALGAATGLLDQSSVIDEADVPLTWAPHASAPGLAAAIAVATVARPWSTSSWRRAVRNALLATAAAMVLCSVISIVELLLAVSVGNVVGAAVLVAVGAPNLRPPPAEVASALGGSGLDLMSLSLQRAVAGRSQLYRAATAAGGRCFVKVYDEDARDADVLYRTAHALIVRMPMAPMVTAKGRAEHELLVLFAARRAGVRCPMPWATAGLAGGATAVAMSEVGGRRLDELASDELSADLLESVWREVALLHDAGMAHGALRVQNIIMTDDGPAFVGLARGEVNADLRSRLLDRAELLASLAGLVGPDAAVASAAGVLSATDLADAMPYLQPLALSRTTRRAMPRRELELVRSCVAAVTSRELAPLVRLERVKVRSLLAVAALAGAFYLLLPQLANVDETFQALRSADWWWIAATIALSVLTYAFAAVGLMSGVSAPLPLARTVQVQLASSFVNRVTPANVGGMALNVRFMQRAGIGSAEAVTGMGLNVIAGALVHAGLLVVFVSWAGQQPGSAFSLPTGSTALVVIAVALAVVGLVAATRRGRWLLRSHLLDFGRRSLQSVAGVVRSPGRLAGLLGGSLGVTAAYGTAFGCAVHAFGGGVGIPELGAVYLGAAALAAVAPTPGGLGAMEAALVAGLTAAGQEPSLALASVLSYRLATFWLPILPGWLAYHGLERRALI